MAAPQDTRGIVDPATLLTHVHFRRHLPAPPLRPYIDRYWLIDWDLPTPYTSRVIPHPAVNITFQWDEDGGTPYAELTGIPRGLYTRTLTGRGRVCGVKFRPGAIRAFAPGVAAGWWTGRALPLDEAVRGPAARGAGREMPDAAETAATREAARRVEAEATREAARRTALAATRGLAARGAAGEMSDAAGAAATPGAARKASDATETAATPGAARKASDATETAATPG
ncbi:DUF6597 domain-containing transcriptional factor, partial [Streptomyces acidiscabies]|uniref:DUF6597 domain-containing transcriptional factor n=1 Tax=Streptomyces acidiscabies TaxID=42234 RepID=UPI0038F78216